MISLKMAANTLSANVSSQYRQQTKHCLICVSGTAIAN